MWLVGDRHFVTGQPSTHFEANIEVMRAFGAAQIELTTDISDPQRRWQVTLQIAA